MKNIIYKFSTAIALIALLSIASCANEVDYREFIKDREKSYPGKLSKMIFRSGNGRIVFEGVADNDPKVNKCIIYWNNNLDSLIIPIEKTAKADPVTATIPLPEKVYHFTVFTYDSSGSRSVPSSFVCRSYGDIYKQSLVNRRCNTPLMDAAGIGKVEWSQMDKTFGPLSTELTYTKTDGTTETVVTLVNENETLLPDYKRGTRFSYRTVYQPDTTCVDNFYTPLISQPMYAELDRSEWSVTASSEDVGDPAINVIDGNPGTIWHSKWQGGEDPYPYDLVFDMKAPMHIYSVKITKREGVNAVKDFEILGSINSEDWKSYGKFSIPSEGRIHNFTLSSSEEMRYIKMHMTKGYGTNANLAEFEVIGM